MTYTGETPVPPRNTSTKYTPDVKPIILAVAVALATTLSGCAGSAARLSDVANLPERAPEDFGLSITVMGPVRAGGESAYAGIGAKLRPGRYVIEPDRSLRAALGPAADDSAYPPRTRRLSAQEMDEVWALVRSSGVLSADHEASASRAPTLDMASGRTVYVVTTRALGGRRMVVVDVEPEPAPSAASVQPLVERVANLAWVK